MNFVERSGAKAAWWFLGKRVPALRKWTPLIGSAALVVSVVLRALGQTDFADAVDSIGKAIGITAQSPVSGTEIAAAGAAVTGIVLKLRSEYRKASEAK